MYDNKPVRKPKDDGNSFQMPTHCGVLGCQSHWNAKEQKWERGKADIVFTVEGTIISRCGDCYDRQIYKTGKGRYCFLTGRDMHLTLDAVREYWDSMDSAK